jgi:hypothetical protein
MKLTMTEVRRISKETGKSFQQILEEHNKKNRSVTRTTDTDFRNDPLWQRTVQTALRMKADIAAKEEERAAEAVKNADEVRAELFPWERK